MLFSLFCRSFYILYGNHINLCLGSYTGNKASKNETIRELSSKKLPPEKGYLPNFPETKDKKVQNKQVNEALQKLTRIYHPDINGKYGTDWQAYCEEISKISNFVYQKIVKNIE